MTDQPPPPPGNYPPPPPPPGGVSAAASAAGWWIPAASAGRWLPSVSAGRRWATRRPPAAAGPVLPKEAYTPWLTRVLAWLIDVIPLAILEGIGWGLLLGTRESACITDTSEYDLGEYCETGASTIGQVVYRPRGDRRARLLDVEFRLSAGHNWFEHRQVDNEVQDCQRKDWAANRFRNVNSARDHLRVAALACGILWLVAVLFPLWDSKRQTLADKIASTIALPI